jgi:hypothetical protein
MQPPHAPSLVYRQNPSLQGGFDIAHFHHHSAQPFMQRYTHHSLLLHHVLHVTFMHGVESPPQPAQGTWGGQGGFSDIVRVRAPISHPVAEKIAALAAVVTVRPNNTRRFMKPLLSV